MAQCWVNGEKTDHVLFNDRGLSYGDGLFTTAKVVNGEVCLFDAHIKRLVEGCRRLNIKFTAFEQLTSHIASITEQVEFAVLKIVITAGNSGRGYSREPLGEPTVIVSMAPFPIHYREWKRHGINLGNANTQLGVQPLIAGLKHLNRLEQVLIRSELDQVGLDDLVVCNIEKHIIETSCANIFWYKNGDIFTPALDKSGVDGLMRQQVLARVDRVKVVSETLDTLSSADEIWICNSLMGIVPVKQYENRHLSMDKAKQIMNMVEC